MLKKLNRHVNIYLEIVENYEYVAFPMKTLVAEEKTRKNQSLARVRWKMHELSK